ncbi:unnamed protein product [Bursaphelenchus okinawaensis]|uniref:Ig-like domain-containing protein n=1 Tax=Bursaphelenchus okinawaensis TaxID=465554 RepID=A0A811L9B0_9BILA|nr:unnamed protein product [Bursaphelenchus okinawaensis]CAG9119653.1 unnamed protein product [Bursaphelenchus okinawaensis]
MWVIFNLAPQGIFVKFAGSSCTWFVFKLLIVHTKLCEPSEKQLSSEKDDDNQAPIVRLPLLAVRELPEASEINLVCTVTGIPPPKIEWFKDDELVTFANFKYDNGIATLNIPEAKLIHSGIYTCLAKNRFGTVRSSGVLYIQPKPSDAQKAPRFEELLCNSTVENGRELSLVCKAVGKPQPSITWLKDGLKIIPNQRLIQYTDRRGVVRLNIINCKAEDAGEYSCEAENGFGRDFTHCTVKVVDDKEKAMNEKKMDKSPQITRNLVDGNVHEGNKFVFECELEADDSPVVKWYHNKTLIEDEKTLRTYFDGRLAILKVFEASSSHAGVYECVASNAFGEVFSSASLLVEKSEESEEYPPNMPEFTTKIRDLTVKEGEDASFTCTVKGALNPSIQWLFNGSALVNSTQTIIQSNDNTHMLAIRNVLTANAGVYTAIAKNIYGDIHCSAELTVEKDESQPLITPIFRYPLHDKTAIVEESVSLKCSVDAAPPPSIIWEKDGKVVQPSNRLRFAQANNVYALKLHDVDMNDAGNYLVRITNPLGSITSECVLMIATESGADSHLVAAESDINRPEFLVKPPEENSVSEGSPLELRVKVKGYPTPNVKWLKDGKEIARTNRSYHTRVTGDGQYVLLIECAILKTSGTFTCVASNKHGHSECHTQLKVKKRASFKSTGESLPPIFASKPSNLTVTAGSPASFKCQVTGNPVPTISWLFVDTNNNKHLLEFEQSGWKLRNNGGVYKIVTDTAVKFQEGTYECTARNNEGTAMCSATLVVNDSEVSMGPPRILEPMNNAAAALNEECSFQVKAAGTPTAVEWFHNDKRVSEDHRIKLRQSKANCYELHITSIKLSDVGSYVLKLSNNDGETSSEAILNVKPSTLPLNPHPKQLKSPIVSPLSPLFQLMPETETVEPKISLKRKGAAPDFVVGLQDIEVAAGDVAAVAGKLQPKKRKHRLFEKHNQEDPKTLAGSLVARLSNENDEQMDYSPQQPRPNTTLAEIGKTIAKRNKEPCAPKFFVKPKPKTEIEEGKSLRLKAAVSGNPIPDVRWDKNGVILETGNKFSIYNDGDLYFLEVHHLSTFDQGFYNCTATNIDGFATCTTHVLVSTSDTLIDKLKKNMKKQQTPLEFLEVLPGREKVNVGQTLSLECIVTGYPAPDILWQRNGTTLVPQTNKYQMFFDGECSTLRFMSLSAADEGTIVCVAENPLGKVMTQTYLEVVSSNTGSANTPQFKKEHVKKQKTVDGKALVIEAPLKNSFEKVEFKWMSGNITIEDSEAFKYGRRKNNLTLTITDPFPEDSGEYVCVAQNRHGESQFTAEVTITDDMKSISHVKKPILKPKQPTIYGSEGCSVDLTAEASGSDPVISWFQEQEQILADEKHEMINSSNEHTLRIHDFEKSDQGGYKLLAINNAGIAEATFDLQLQSNTKLRNGTKPSFVQFPKNVQSKPNETVTVTCEFEGDPVPKVSWFKGSRQLESNENIVIETTPTSSQLSISMVDADLQGEYLCTIRNPFGEELNSLTILMLQDGLATW